MKEKGGRERERPLPFKRTACNSLLLKFLATLQKATSEHVCAASINETDRQTGDRRRKRRRDINNWQRNK